MRSRLLLLSLVLLWPGVVRAQGLLVPEDKTLAPLAVVRHQVNVTLDEQVAITRVEQTFRNPADHPLEATYLFPVPKGASVHEFALWVGGKKQSGELLPADAARQTYTDIVRRTQDPALLEYVGSNLLRLRVFPIPPHGEQKVTLSYTSVVERDGGVIGYVYPLKTAGESFSLEAVVKSKHGVQSVYSPSHAVTVKQANDHEATVSCTKANGDRDFQLFFAPGEKDVGLTTLTYRPVSTEEGEFLMLLTPKVDLKAPPAPRDLVLVLDTSGSMRGTKIEQAKKALNYCLSNLNKDDRFAVIHFCSTVNNYRDHLVPSSGEQVDDAKRWVNRLEATSGTAINDALQAALALRSEDSGRTFTVVFFTDGLPTEGECNPDQIIKNVMAKNTANTRIFTFGVGDDVNAALLDQLADRTRAVSTFVRPGEDIEAKTSALYDKISHPVLTNLKLTVSGDVRWSEVYPPHLPDLFHGGQLVVLGRYDGHGTATVTLTGTVGSEQKEIACATVFPKKTGADRAFVEQLWARRKVGYLLDQIRVNGEKKELVEEVKTLAKKHGIATPYTSYLVAPDGAQAAANGQTLGDSQSYVTFGGQPATPMVSLVRSNLKDANESKTSRERLFVKSLNGVEGFVPPGEHTVSPASSMCTTPAANALPQGRYLNYAPQFVPPATAIPAPIAELYREGISAAPRPGQLVAVRGLVDTDGSIPQNQQVYAQAATALSSGNRDGYQSGRVGVELALQLRGLREQDRLDAAGAKSVAGRTLHAVNGAWIDDAFDAKMPLIEVKAMSAAYFRMLERRPELKEVFKLGTRLVWTTPSGKALVIAENGKEKLSDAEIDALFITTK